MDQLDLDREGVSKGAGPALPDPTFDGLVKNALSFLTSSLAALQSNSKGSVIDFYTAVELFLKARLVHEHWTLAVDSRPDLKSFLSGDFVSVGFKESCQR